MNRVDQQSTRTPLLSLACLALAVLIFAGFFAYQSIVERNALLTTISSQEQPLQQANQVKAQLGALATATAKLAAALQVVSPMLESTLVAWTDADRKLGSGADHTAVIRWLEALQPPSKQTDAEEPANSATRTRR